MNSDLILQFVIFCGVISVIYGFILVCSVIVYRDQSLQIYQFSQDKIKKIFK